MLSSLPKLADRNFILGHLLPTLLFAIAALFLFRDLLSADGIATIISGKDLGTAAYLLLAVWVIAVMTLMLNFWIYRFLEGYSFPEWLAEGLKRRNRKRLRRSLCQIQILYERWAEQGTSFSQADLNRYQMLLWNLLRWMPSRESDILPTCFGNAIKAFETYPGEIYGADGVVVWLRLVSVMPKQFLEHIQDARTRIDCSINCWFFSGIIALLALVRAIYSSDWDKFNLETLSRFYGFISAIEIVWLFWALGGIIAAYLFYLAAVACVPAWGELVMSAFDCYLPMLAAQLGFELPVTESARRQFWTTLSQQLIYRRGLDGKLPFRIEDWKQVSSNKNKEQARGGTEDRDDVAQETGGDAEAKENSDD